MTLLRLLRFCLSTTETAVEFDASTLKPRDAYALMTGLVVPRPIAWVSTCDKNGHINLAPFSYFNALASDPMMLTISIARRRDGTDKDTLRIAKETGVFCVNLVESGDLAVMNQTSAELAPDESEAVRFDVATVACAHIAGVRIASARAAWECVLKDVHVYGNKAAVSLVVGEVKGVYVDDALYAGFVSTGGIAADAVDPVARLGGANYAMLGKRLSLPRP